MLIRTFVWSEVSRLSHTFLTPATLFPFCHFHFHLSACHTNTFESLIRGQFCCIYLRRESQPPFVGLYEVGGLYEDMHGLHQDQGERLKIVLTRMQTDMMGACTYAGPRPEGVQSTSRSRCRRTIQSNMTTAQSHTIMLWCGM